MTERRLLESAVGLPGRLSHIPHGVGNSEECGWHSSRTFCEDDSSFRIVGRSHTWIPAERDYAVDSLAPPGTAWEHGRRQHVWLMRNHPEASLGNYLLHDQLEEHRTSVQLQDRFSWHTCFCSLGELTDTTVKKRCGVPMVATVTGSANNILCLTMPNQAKWKWPQEPNIEVSLSEIPTEKPALWIEEDVGPIHRVKCILDLKRYDPTRWVAVQRDSGTTILQPEYRTRPEGGDLGRGTSHIVANPILQILKEQTGGNVHSDISFNPSTRSNSPQLAIIDERGYWSIWDLQYSRPKPAGELVSNLRKCGHIDRGVLKRLPLRGHSDMRWHKILWVGRSEEGLELLGNLDLDLDDEEVRPHAVVSPLQRSTSVLICNSHRVRLLDLTTGLFLPDLAFQRHDGRDSILDLQISHDPQYFYLLTTSKLFIVRVYSRLGIEWGKPEKVWLVLYSTPHFRSPLDRSPRLAIAKGPKSGQTTSLVFIYSSASSWVDVFNVEFSRTDPNAVKCQTNIGGLDKLQNKHFNNAIQALYINPIPIIVKNTRADTKMGRSMAEKRTRLYEVTTLRPDRSLITVLCAYSQSRTRISTPNERVDRKAMVKRRRRLGISCISSSFVVDDESTASEEEVSVVAYRNLQPFYKHIMTNHHILRSSRSVVSTKNSVLRHNPFDTAHQNVEDVLANGSLPISILLQLMPSFGDVSSGFLSVVDWEQEVGRLNNIHPSVAVRELGLLRPYSNLTFPASLQQTYQKILGFASNSAPHASNNNAEEGWIATVSERIAYDLYLSLYGIGHYSLGHDRVQAVPGRDILLTSQASEAETLPSSPPAPESIASPTWSQMSNPETTEHEDPAMTLLRAYTGSGQFVPEKRLELLDKWRLGAEPSNYSFDLDRSDDAHIGQLRKAKQAAREHRKRRRTETLLQLSQIPELPATQPAPETSFFSSQPRVVSLQKQMIHSDPLRGPSQSLGGPFGKRPHKKVKKQKGGFR